MSKGPRLVPSTLWVGLTLLVAACNTGPAPDASAARDDFVFTFIRTGPTAPNTLGQERVAELFAGHFGNMTTMAEAGQLLLAGPFGQPPVSPDLRGIFVFDTGDLGEGQAWGETDPPTQAGLFQLESYRWHADADVREIPARDQLLLASIPEEERENPGATARAYVLCLAADAAAIEERLEPFRDADELCLFGTLGAGSDGAPDRNGQALFILAAASPDAARARATELGVDLEGVEIHPWFASKAVEQLGRN